MSAQDDVLAAFGEPRPVSAAKDKPGVEQEVGEQVAEEVAEQAAADVSEQAPAEVDDQAESEQAAGEQAAAEVSEQPRAEAGEQIAAEPISDTEPGLASAAEQVDGSDAAEVTSEEPTGEPAETSDTELDHAPAAEQVLAANQVEAAEQVQAAEQAPEEPAAEPPALPAPPPQPYLDPAAFFAELQAEAAPKPQRRWPRLALRYASALVVAGAVGAGTAYAVTLPRRTDVPFLATPGDGRYAFLNLVKPPPPVGKPAPGADGNDGQVHYNDLRQYLLPAPIGGLVKEDGWEPVADFEASVTGTDVADHLYDEGLRHVARRGWTARDGQHTVIELLQFPDHQSAFAVESVLDTATPAKAGHAETVVPTVTTAGFGDTTETVTLRKFDQVDGLPGQTERRVVFQTGDVVAVITTTAPAKVPDTPTEQVVMLEAQMLR